MLRENKTAETFHPNPNAAVRELHVLVVDDDPIFRRVMEKLGRKRNVSVTTCSSLRELNTFASPGMFDVAVIDYYLDDLKENLKGTDIADLMEDTPVILVSRSEHCIVDHEAWPDSVRKFVHKGHGGEAIFDAALKLREPKA